MCCVGGKNQWLYIYNRRFQVDFSKSATTCLWVSPCAMLWVMADKNDKRIVFYLDEESAAALTVVAAGADRPVSWVVRQVVLNWLEDSRRAQG